jgi:hypothetical protein
MHANKRLREKPRSILSVVFNRRKSGKEMEKRGWTSGNKGRQLEVATVRVLLKPCIYENKAPSLVMAAIAILCTI